MCLFGKCDYEDSEGECILKENEQKPCKIKGGENNGKDNSKK